MRYGKELWRVVLGRFDLVVHPGGAAHRPAGIDGAQPMKQEAPGERVHKP